MKTKRFLARPVLGAGLWILFVGGLFYFSGQNGACKPLFSKSPAVTPDPQAIRLQDSFAEVASTVKPAVVSITTVHTESIEAAPYQFYFGDPMEDFFQDFFGAPGAPPGQGALPRQAPPRRFQRRQMGMGSGVIIDARGYILTNEHVVRGADEIKVSVTEPEAREYKGKVVGKDPRTDLAVVKIVSPGHFTAVSLGDSDRVRVGDWAMAIGSPFGLSQTVTVGIISAVRQSLSIEGNSYNNLLQTDAAINQGNSGGPLINIRGEVIGINTAIYAPTGVFAGIGFAIPSNRAKEIMEQLIEKGRVVRGWLGVEIAPLNDVIAQQFGVPDQKGAIVNAVVPGSPAEKAGLLRGDVIREFDGAAISDPESLIQRVGKTPPKKRINLKIWRSGASKSMTLVTGEMPAETDQAASPPASERPKPEDIAQWQGADLSPLTPALAQRLSASSPGVVVIKVRPGSLAADLGLEEGDVILSLNREPTPTVEKFQALAKQASAQKGILLDVSRQGRLIYLSFKKGA